MQDKFLEGRNLPIPTHHVIISDDDAGAAAWRLAGIDREMGKAVSPRRVADRRPRRIFCHINRGALAIGARPERLAVEPIPPGWDGNGAADGRYESWVDGIIAFYGDVKPSMLQDFERGRKTEIDFINGYVARLGGEFNVPVRMNAAITDLVHGIERGEAQPAFERLDDLRRIADM